MVLSHDTDLCEVRSATRGTATLRRRGTCYEYRRERGDPLGLGADFTVDADAAHDATRGGDYPDAIVQIAELAGAARSGDIILSAAPGYDFRSRYEPIPHRSAHGALHRDHMLVPLLLNRPPARAPRRTTDLFASAVSILGVNTSVTLDGRSFL
jgi:hypothetical protein